MDLICAHADKALLYLIAGGPRGPFFCINHLPKASRRCRRENTSAGWAAFFWFDQRRRSFFFLMCWTFSIFPVCGIIWWRKIRQHVDFLTQALYEEKSNLGVEVNVFLDRRRLISARSPPSWWIFHTTPPSSPRWRPGLHIFTDPADVLEISAHLFSFAKTSLIGSNRDGVRLRTRVPLVVDQQLPVLLSGPPKDTLKGTTSDQRRVRSPKTKNPRAESKVRFVWRVRLYHGTGAQREHEV